MICNREVGYVLKAESERFENGFRVKCVLGVIATSSVTRHV